MPITPHPSSHPPLLICTTCSTFNFLKRNLVNAASYQVYVSLVEVNDSVCLVKFLGNSPQVLKSYHSEWFKNRAGSCHSVQRLSNRKPIQWQTDEFLLQSNFKGHQRPLYLVHPLRSLTRTPCKYLEILKSKILQQGLLVIVTYDKLLCVKPAVAFISHN